MPIRRRRRFIARSAQKRKHPPPSAPGAALFQASMTASRVGIFSRALTQARNSGPMKMTHNASCRTADKYAAAGEIAPERNQLPLLHRNAAPNVNAITLISVTAGILTNSAAATSNAAQTAAVISHNSPLTLNPPVSPTME